MRASAPQIGAAAFDIHTDSRAPKTPDWEPAPGDSVSLLAMGGSKGQVITGPDARGRYSVKVCNDQPTSGSGKVTFMQLQGCGCIFRVGSSAMVKPLHGGMLAVSVGVHTPLL